MTLCSDRDIATGELRINTQKYFEMLSKDKDEAIMLLNYFIEKGEAASSATSKTNYKHENNPNQRIRVNDKTATGGWF